MYVHEINGQKWSYEGGNEWKDVQEYLGGLQIEAILASEKELNPNWERMRYEWLEAMLRDKYKRNNELKEKLKKTGDRTILYILDDLYLGSDGKNGQNTIGRITHDIRNDINDYNDHTFWLLRCCEMCTDDFPLSIREEGKEGVKTHELRKSNCYNIGRLPQCHIRPLNVSISRVHTSIYLNTRSEVFIVNYSATSGMKLNNDILPDHLPVKLNNNDTFTLGASTRVYTVLIDENIAQRRIQVLEDEKRLLNKTVAIKRQHAHDELKLYLEGALDVVVTNISYKTKRTELLDFFDSCGLIESIDIPQRGSGISNDDDCNAETGIAFIKFKDRKGAAAAIEKDGTYLNYRKIKVKYNQNKWERRHENKVSNRRHRDSSNEGRQRSQQYKAKSSRNIDHISSSSHRKRDRSSSLPRRRRSSPSYSPPRRSKVRDRRTPSYNKYK